MHSALFLLLKLRFRGLGRRFAKGLRKPTGVLMAVFGVGLLALWLGPMVISGLVGPKHPPDPVARYGPAVMALILLANIVSRTARAGTQFTRADVDQLFPAPLPRRDLLLYKCAEMLTAAIGLALFFSIMLAWFESPWIATFFALVLALQFINLASMAVSMAGEAVRRLLRPAAAKVAFVAAVAALIYFASQQIRFDWEAGLSTNVHAVLDAPIAQAALLPLWPFAGVFIAASLPSFLINVIIALAMISALFTLIVYLDGQTIDATIARSLEYQKHLQRAQKHAGLSVRVSARTARLRIGQPPWWRGAGPIVWKQFNTAIRSLSALALPVLIGLGIFVSIAVFGPDEHTLRAAISIIIVVVLGFTLPQVLLFDFRSELDQMDWLKRLPIPPVPLAIGEVATPVIITTIVQWIMLIVASALGTISSAIAAAIAALVLPFNLLNVAIENAGFLLYPTRQLATGMADLVAFSRMMLLFFVRGAALLAGAGVASLLGLLAWLLTGESLAAFVIVAWIALAVLASLSLLAVSVAFQAFDVSRDLPV